jgi:hypothetical protein
MPRLVEVMGSLLGAVIARCAAAPQERLYFAASAKANSSLRGVSPVAPVRAAFYTRAKPATSPLEFT